MRDDLVPQPSALDHAQRRLARALDALEARARALKTASPAVGAGDARKLQLELEGAHARERALEQVAAEASAALGRAAAEVRAVLAAEA